MGDHDRPAAPASMCILPSAGRSGKAFWHKSRRKVAAIWANCPLAERPRSPHLV